MEVNDLRKLGIISIGFDASGHSWMGTFDGGVFRYDPSGHTCRHYVKNESETGALSDNVVWSIFSDHTQTLWLGTRNFLNRYDAGSDRFVSYKPDPKDPHAISHNVISYLYEDQQGDLWIATLGGGVTGIDAARTTSSTSRQKKDFRMIMCMALFRISRVITGSPRKGNCPVHAGIRNDYAISSEGWKERESLQHQQHRRDERWRADVRRK